jgi:hypothetical protein
MPQLIHFCGNMDAELGNVDSLLVLDHAQKEEQVQKQLLGLDVASE